MIIMITIILGNHSEQKYQVLATLIFGGADI